ncbi:MAG: DUF393 domain-containing protein [Alphaproteobacteria bacterium]|nr:DUF393 domain-containing protein [Alphaproteobacteria bacterium]
MRVHGLKHRYSYRADPAVPGFDDENPITFMDGDCVLCAASARLIARLDRRNEIRICRIQSDLGGAILSHYGIDPVDPESWLYLEDGNAFTSMDGVIRLGTRMGGWGKLLIGLRILPRVLQDWLYRRVARNRHRLFGRTDICAIPDPGLRARLME